MILNGLLLIMELNNNFPGKKVGVGVYCTPNIETAAGYSEVFTGNDGKKYKLVFQARVKPSAIVRCKDIDSSAPKDYWYIKDKKDIRCYSICVKKVD